MSCIAMLFYGCNKVRDSLLQPKMWTSRCFYISSLSDNPKREKNGSPTGTAARQQAQKQSPCTIAAGPLLPSAALIVGLPAQA